MNDYIKEKKYLSLLSNQGKRKELVQEDSNWKIIEISERGKVRICSLRFTDFIKVQVQVYNKYLDHYRYQTLAYYLMLDGVIQSMQYSESDIVNKLAQMVLEYKQKEKSK